VTGQGIVFIDVLGPRSGARRDLTFHRAKFISPSLRNRTNIDGGACCRRSCHCPASLFQLAIALRALYLINQP
jgi:hypothetical protein